jgi:hypothetical protein
MSEERTDTTPTPTPTETPAPAAAPSRESSSETSIPYARFAEVYDAKKALQAQNEAILGERDQLRAELDPLRSQVARLGDDLALARAGIRDEEGAAVARALHSALPEENRPAIGDWIGSFGEDAPAPRGLAVYLSGGSSSAPAPAAPEAPAPAAAPAVTRTTQPGSASGPTAAQIRRAREDAQSSGDWSAFNTLIGSLPGMSGRSRR